MGGGRVLWSQDGKNIRVHPVQPAGEPLARITYIYFLSRIFVTAASGPAVPDVEAEIPQTTVTNFI